MTTLTRTRSELASALDALPGERALVMTMGALHGGHLTLVDEARRHADHVVVSVYVNPLQFGPGEDLEAYPRTLDADLALLEGRGVDVVFAPTDEEMYPGLPDRPAVRIDPGPIATSFEGATRPGHFAGVAQVVAKVVNLARPRVSVFGQKDAQQLALVRSLVADLDLPGEIVAVPISRDPDGLARSSRNAYLDAPERRRALALSRALRAGVQAAGRAGATPAGIEAAAREVLEEVPADDPQAARVPFEPDYLRLVDAATFVPLATPGGEAARPRAGDDEGMVDGVLVVAVRVGTTRLIDNAPLRVPAPR